MCNRFRKSLSLFLAVALVALLVPASVLTAQAADATPEGIVLFEEDFSGYSSWSEFSSAYSELSPSNAIQTQTYTEEGLVIAADTNNRFIDLVFNAKIPAVTSYSSTPALMVECVVSTNNARFYTAVPTIKYADGTEGNTNSLYQTYAPYAMSNYTENEATYSVCIYPRANATYQYGLSELKFRFGARQIDGKSDNAGNTNDGTTGTVTIHSIKVSMIYHNPNNNGTTAADLRNYTTGGSYVQLLNDVTVDAADLNMGAGAVLDLNGYTLTLQDGYKWNAAPGAEIIDSSAEKTGKIACATADQLNITNPSNPQLPIWTGAGYYFIEPVLTPSVHMIPKVENAEGFTLHFRPGLGYVNGGVNVRENYVANNPAHGLTMDAKLSWVDIYGEEGESEDTGLDAMFNGMYASDTARGVLSVTGVQKYQSISLTITLRSGNVVWELPAYTYENNYVTVHYQQSFDNNTGEAIALNNKTNQNTYYTPNGQTPSSNVTAEGKLDVVEAGSFVIPTAYPVGENKTMVIEFNAEVSHKFAIHVRDTSNNRNQLISFGGYDNAPFNLALPCTTNIRLEINMITGVVKAFQNGNQILTKDSSDTSTIATTLNPTYLYLNTDNTTAGNILLDNLLIYSYDTVTE